MRGEVFRYTNPRVQGHEQSGRRYAVAVQSDDVYLSTLLVVPTSTRVTPTEFRAEVTIKGETTYVLAEQLTAVDPQRLGESVGFLTFGDLRSVDAALFRVLDLDGFS